MHKMKGNPMPKDHHETKQKQAPVCGEKYATEFGNPHDLDKSTEALASYTKKHKMKY